MAKAINFPSITGGGSVGFAHQNPTTDVTVTLQNESHTMPIMRLFTAQASTAGTSIDFTGIPAWAKKITVMFNGVSTNGTSLVIVQLGTSGGIQTSGYLGSASQIGATTSNYNTGYIVGGGAATSVLNGNMFILNQNNGSGIWSESHNIGLSDSNSMNIGGGIKTLSGTLTQIRITTVGGTDTFDAGSINILVEGY